MTHHRLRGLHGSLVALATPFTNGRIDEDAFVLLCERQIERGTAALVPCGTTGEACSLDPSEQGRLIRLAVETAKGRVPVIAGAGSNCTATTIALVAQAEGLGADGVLTVVPYYNRPTQEGLIRHFHAVQSNTSLPVVLYDVPSRTGTRLDLDTVLRLAEYPNIVGLKDATGDVARATTLRQGLPDDFLLLCGNDALTPDYLALGSQGCISVSANVAPALCAALHAAWENNEFSKFQELRDKLDILAEALFVESNPIPLKYALVCQGLLSGELRLPLTPLAERYRAGVRHALDIIVPAEAIEAAQLAARPGHRLAS